MESHLTGMTTLDTQNSGTSYLLCQILILFGTLAMDRHIPDLKFDHTIRDIEVARSLSQLVYGSKHDNFYQEFVKTFKPWLLDVLQCPISDQKYAVAVLQRLSRSSTARVLFVAFAGTSTMNDWKTNVAAGITSDLNIGGDVHTGFSKRVGHVKFNGLKRLALTWECTTVVFVGHSLGGAVASLAALQALNKQIFGAKMEVLAIGFGTPLCVTQRFAQEVMRNDWERKFLTIVNAGDPVPRILNIAATVSKLEVDGKGFLEVVQPFLEALQLLTPLLGLGGLQIQAADAFLSKFKDLHNSRFAELLRSRLIEHGSNYTPLGVYAMGFDEQSADRARSLTLIKGEGCKELLGGASLLTPESSVSMLNYQGIVEHSLPKYRHLISSVAFQEKIPLGSYSYQNHNVQPTEVIEVETCKIEEARFSLYRSGETQEPLDSGEEMLIFGRFNSNSY